MHQVRANYSQKGGGWNYWESCPGEAVVCDCRCVTACGMRHSDSASGAGARFRKGLLVEAEPGPPLLVPQFLVVWMLRKVEAWQVCECYHMRMMMQYWKWGWTLLAEKLKLGIGHLRDPWAVIFNPFFSGSWSSTWRLYVAVCICLVLPSLLLFSWPSLPPSLACITLQI